MGCGSDKGEQTSNAAAAAVNKQPHKEKQSRAAAAAAQRLLHPRLLLLLLLLTTVCAQSCLGLNYVIPTMLQFHIFLSIFMLLHSSFFVNPVYTSGQRLFDPVCKEECEYNTGTSDCSVWWWWWWWGSATDAPPSVPPP